MKATELRIGNLILNGVNKDINVDMTVLDFILHNPDKLEPIPLTEEWLEKLGFEETGSTSDSGVKSNIRYGIFFGDNYLDIDGDYASIRSSKEGWGKTRIKIQYVHQLQNIYFALTQQELEIRELANG